MKRTNYFLAAIALLILGTSAFAQVPSYVPTNGLVGWWPFNGNANDESGNGFNATPSGAQLSSDRFSNANSCYSFTGQSGNGVTGTYMSFPNVGINTFPEYTVSIWVNEQSVLGDGESYFYFGGNNQCGINFARGAGGAGGGFGYGYGCQAGLHQSVALTNQWVMYTGTRSNNVIKLYINGVEFGSRTDQVSQSLGSTENYLARHTWGPDPGQTSTRFNGKLDDLGIWNRALTPQEILNLYTGCAPSITTQPANQTASVASSAQFSVVSSDPGATFQWQTDLGLGYQNISNAGQYNGANTSTLTVSNLTMTNDNQIFRCIATSGSCADTSDVVVLTVCGAITTQPANQNATVANNAQFSVVSSDPGATFQWQSDLGLGYQNISNAGQYSGATTNTLTVSNLTLTNNNQVFRCIVTSGSCIDTSDVAVLTVQNPTGVVVGQLASITLSPNPTDGPLKVTGLPEGSKYQLMDTQGRKIVSGQGSGTLTLDLSSLPAGVYMLSVEAESGKAFRKVVLQR